MKGPFALAFVTAVAVVESFRRRNDPARGRVAWGGLLVGTLAPPLAWLGLVAHDLGSVGAVFDEMLSQATGSEGAHAKPGVLGWLYFVGVIPAYALPWAIPAIPALVWAWRRRRGGDSPLAPFPAFAWSAFLVGLVAITLVPAKQEHYMLPLLPAAFLLIGAAFDDVLEAATPRIARWAPLVALACGALLAANRLYGARIVEFVAPTMLFDAVGIIVFELTNLAPLPMKSRASIVCFVTAAALCGWAAQADGVRYRATDDYRETAAAVSLPGDERLEIVGFAAGSREAFDTLVAWLEGPNARYVRMTTVDEVRKRIAAGGRFRLLVGSDEEKALAPVAESLKLRGMFAPRQPKAAKDTVLLFVPRGG